MTIDVRDATLDDIAGCHRCLDDVSKEGRWPSRLSAPPFDGCRIHDSPASRPGAQIVAVDDRVVGWCDIRLDASPVRRMSGPWAWGSSVSIVGRELDAAACNWRCNALAKRIGTHRALRPPRKCRCPGTLRAIWLPDRRPSCSRLETRRCLPGQHSHGFCLQLTSKHSAAQVAFSSRPPGGTVCRRPEPKRSGRAGNGRSGKCAVAHKGWLSRER